MTDIENFGFIKKKDSLTFTTCPNCKHEFPICFEAHKAYTNGRSTSYDDFYIKIMDFYGEQIKNTITELKEQYPDYPPEGKYTLIKDPVVIIKNPRKIENGKM